MAVGDRTAPARVAPTHQGACGWTLATATMILCRALMNTWALEGIGVWTHTCLLHIINHIASVRHTPRRLPSTFSFGQACQRAQENQA